MKKEDNENLKRERLANAQALAIGEGAVNQEVWVRNHKAWAKEDHRINKGAILKFEKGRANFLKMLKRHGINESTPVSQIINRLNAIKSKQKTQRMKIPDARIIKGYLNK